MTSPGTRLLASVREARRFARGEASDGFVVHIPNTVDVRAIRERRGMTQEAFARRFGFSTAAVRDWEQGRRQPEQAARVLLLIIRDHPEIVESVLRAAPPPPAE